MTYRTFIRSARNFAEFAKAKKVTRDTGLSQEEARRACDHYNKTRSPQQIAKGTKLEYEKE